MAQERPNRLTEWLLLTRKQVPVVRQHFENWLAAVREEPALVWQTPAVRYATYGAGGLMLVWIATWVAGGLAPPLPEDARPATRADFHVVCTNPECGYHFVIHRKLGFHGFPVKCPRCQQKTGTQARAATRQPAGEDGLHRKRSKVSFTVLYAAVDFGNRHD